MPLLIITGAWVEGSRKLQISPLRCAPVEMTNERFVTHLNIRGLEKAEMMLTPLLLR